MDGLVIGCWLSVVEWRRRDARHRQNPKSATTTTNKNGRSLRSGAMHTRTDTHAPPPLPPPRTHTRTHQLLHNSPPLLMSVSAPTLRSKSGFRSSHSSCRLPSNDNAAAAGPPPPPPPATDRRGAGSRTPGRLPTTATAAATTCVVVVVGASAEPPPSPPPPSPSPSAPEPLVAT